MYWIKKKRKTVARPKSWWQNAPRTLWSSTAAAWVQAIGAIIALALTLSLSYESKHEARLKNIRALAVYLDITRTNMVLFAMACQEKNLAKMRLQPDFIAESIDLGRKIDASELSTSDMRMVSQLQGMLLTVKLEIELHREAGETGEPFWNMCRKRAVALTTTFDQLIKEVRQLLPEDERESIEEQFVAPVAPTIP